MADFVVSTRQGNLYHVSCEAYGFRAMWKVQSEKNEEPIVAVEINNFITIYGEFFSTCGEDITTKHPVLISERKNLRTVVTVKPYGISDSRTALEL